MIFAVTACSAPVTRPGDATGETGAPRDDELVAPNDGENDPARRSSVPVPGEGQPTVFEGQMEEWVSLFVQCFLDAGWEARATPDDPFGGYFTVVIPPGQDDALMAVDAECKRSVGTMPLPAIDEDNARVSFDQAVIDHGCLVDQGLSMPDAPSFEWYWSEYQRRQSPPWDPFVDATWDPDWRAAVTECRS